MNTHASQATPTTRSAYSLTLRLRHIAPSAGVKARIKGRRMDEDDRSKVVFDTGPVLQAALSDMGPAFQALLLLDEEKIVVFTSPLVRSEYEDVLTRQSIREKNPVLTEE